MMYKTQDLDELSRRIKNTSMKFHGLRENPIFRNIFMQNLKFFNENTIEKMDNLCILSKYHNFQLYLLNVAGRFLMIPIGLLITSILIPQTRNEYDL